MPKGNKNLIQSLRSAHDPHFKLEGRVEELEKKLPIQIADLHKTLSKSFGMQRKTLVRVLALEKKIEELKAAKEKVEEVVKDIGEDKVKEVVEDIKEEKTPEEKAPEEKAPEEKAPQEETASEEEIPEGLDDVLDDIRGEKEEGGTETKKPTATKKKPTATKKKSKKKPRKKPTARKIPKKKLVAKKKKISAAALKKGTALDPDFRSRVMGEDEEGEYLSPEERKIRFKKSKISADSIRGGKPVDPPPELPAAKDDKETETEGLKGIRDVLDDILKVLRLDFKGDRKEAREDQKVAAQDKREKREGKLEGGGIKKSVGLIGKGLKAVVSPFTSIWDSVIKFIKFTIIGVLFNKAMKWFNNPKNEEKAKRIGKFFKDWWPTLATAAALFLTPLGGLVKGVVGLLTAIIPKIVMAIAANPFAALALVGTGLAIWGISKMANRNQNNEGGGEVDEGETTQSMSGGGLVKSSPIQKYNEGGAVTVIDAPKSAQNFVQKFNEGGLVQHFEEGGSPQEIEEGTTKKQWTTEDIVSATGPSLMIFMEEQNAAVDENPEAWGGIKLKLDRDGKMPNFGEFIMAQGEAAFNQGIEMLQNNEAMEPEVKEALLKKALFIRSQTLENPNFKADVAFDINKEIPGTAANRLFMKAQADTTSPAAMAGLSARDRALAMNRAKMSGGGLVRGFNTGGKVPGSGNKDTVPAMLTPGEFVMSKGAVNKYGMDTLENMNAAAGSTGSGSSSKKKDTVPAMLTPGEFVVSAPAVQQYGVDTMESMNLKGGGNNKPEIKVGANKGGLINNYNNIVSQYQGGGVVGEEDSRVIIDIIKKTTNNNMDPVDVPVPAAKNTTITLPTIPKNKPEETTTSQNDIPTFRVSMISNQRSMVISSLGISDLVGG